MGHATHKHGEPQAPQAGEAGTAAPSLSAALPVSPWGIMLHKRVPLV